MRSKEGYTITEQLQTMFLLKDKPIISKNPKELNEHPLSKKLFGDLPEKDFEQLKNDIKRRGIQDPLHITKNDVVISGHQRRMIAANLGINVPCIIRNDLAEDWQVEQQIILDNLLRRQLKDWQIPPISKHLEEIEKKKAKERQKLLAGTRPNKESDLKENLPEGDKGQSRDKVANQFGISGKQYDKIKTIDDKAPKEIKQQWKQNKITTHTAYLRTKKHIRKKEREKQKKKKTKKQDNTSFDNIKNMDCFDFLKTIENNSIDLVITDPPYEISKETGFIKMSEMGVDKLGISMDFGKWDKNFKNLPIIIEEFYRILKPNGTLIIFYDIWKITKLTKMLTDVKFKQLRFIEWIKTNPVPINSKINYLTNAREIAITCVKNGKPTFNSEYDNGIYKHPIFHNGKRIHPTQKPVKLFEELIEKHSDKNNVILDCFLGSGTTIIAAKNLKRRCIGCEIDKEYYNLIIKRLNDGE